MNNELGEVWFDFLPQLAQTVEYSAFNRAVKGSSPLLGFFIDINVFLFIIEFKFRSARLTMEKSDIEHYLMIFATVIGRPIVAMLAVLSLMGLVSESKESCNKGVVIVCATVVLVACTLDILTTVAICMCYKFSKKASSPPPPYTEPVKPETAQFTPPTTDEEQAAIIHVGSFS